MFMGSGPVVYISEGVDGDQKRASSALYLELLVVRIPSMYADAWNGAQILFKSSMCP